MTCENPYFEVIQGEDRFVILRITVGKGGLPYSLAGITDLRVKLRKAVGGTLEKVLGPDVAVVDAALGKFSLQLTQLDTPQLLVGERLDFTVVVNKGLRATTISSGITYTAVTPGSLGNSIALVFDGVKTITQVVNAWNTANASNQVGFTGGPGSTVPSSGTVTLSGGTNNKREINFERSITVRKPSV